ncbi:DUF6443 domain-containing protein, partial [Viscerimonas tarda]
MKTKYIILALLYALTEISVAQNNMQDAIDAGVKNSSFTYTSTWNTVNCTNAYQGQFTNDVFYKFTLTKPMTVTISLCSFDTNGNEDTDFDTYLHLLNASGGLIDEIDDEYGYCLSDYHSHLEMKDLPAGTYYVVSEGYNQNGNITTTIEGKTVGSANSNFVHTRTMTRNDGSAYIDQIQYFDGLGRPLETVQRGITPARKDLITYQEYDVLGRESNAWLPRVSTGDNGNFVPLNTFTGLSSSIYQNDTKAYSKPVYEASPLNRIVEQYGPGQAWQNNGKSVKTSYLSNNTTVLAELKCRWYSVSGSGLTTALQSNGHYAVNQLFVTKMEDEDGNTSYEFKDKLGRVALTRQKNGTSASTTNTDIYYDTYYVYDDFGNLCYVLPPMINLTATPANGDENDALKRYAYLYKYDNRNRCVKKRLPGCDWIKYIYDDADRLVFSQDGEQRIRETTETPSGGTPGRWSFYIYDAFGRTVVTGESENPSFSGVVRASYGGGDPLFGNYDIQGIGFSWNNCKIYTINYYDNYNFLSQTGFSFLSFSVALGSGLPNYGYDTRYGDNNDPIAAKGLLTGSITAVLDNSTTASFVRKTFYYDYDGRLIQSRTKTPPYDVVDCEYISYNFSGQPIEKKIYHGAGLEHDIYERYKYTYDHAGRLMTVKHMLNDENADRPEIILAQNTYDELGRLKTTAPKNNTTMKLTYTYNTRSWLTNISGTRLSENIYYNQPAFGGTPRYNGNISTVLFDNYLGYNYTYDNMNRLTQAQSIMTGDWGTSYGAYDTQYTYDKNGNMTSLFRLSD